MLICCSYANIAQTLMLIYSKQQFFQLCTMSQHQTRAISLLLEVEPPNFQPMFLSICGMRISKNLIFKNCELCLKRCCAYTFKIHKKCSLAYGAGASRTFNLGTPFFGSGISRTQIFFCFFQISKFFILTDLRGIFLFFPYITLLNFYSKAICHAFRLRNIFFWLTDP